MAPQRNSLLIYARIKQSTLMDTLHDMTDSTTLRAAFILSIGLFEQRQKLALFVRQRAARSLCSKFYAVLECQSTITRRFSILSFKICMPHLDCVLGIYLGIYLPKKLKYNTRLKEIVKPHLSDICKCNRNTVLFIAFLSGNRYRLVQVTQLKIIDRQ